MNYITDLHTCNPWHGLDCCNVGVWWEQFLGWLHFAGHFEKEQWHKDISDFWSYFSTARSTWSKPSRSCSLMQLCMDPASSLPSQLWFCHIPLPHKHFNQTQQWLLEIRLRRSSHYSLCLLHVLECSTYSLLEHCLASHSGQREGGLVSVQWPHFVT